MDRKDRIDAFGGSVLVIFSAVLGLNQVLIKIVNSGFSPVFQAGLRSLGAILPVLIIACVFKKKLSLTDGSFWPGIFCGILFAIEFIFLFMALDYTTVARSAIISYSMPVWLAIMVHFCVPGETMFPARIAGLAIALIGVSVALSGSFTQGAEGSFMGDVMALVGSLCWAGIALTVRLSKLSRSSPEMQLLYQLSVSALILIPLAPLFGDMVRDVTPAIVGILAFQTFFVVAIGFTTWLWVLSVYPASDMASFSFLAPVFGVLFGWLILDEALSYSVIIALTLVSIGIVLINRRPTA